MMFVAVSELVDGISIIDLRTSYLSWQRLASAIKYGCNKRYLAGL